ncbi:MAG: prepilin-type N-terminal cleavage/methylation domain-containing protein [Clostridiales bacterium]|nr:prepilin-type N-terminal cleavage/methylation domain-containing protein [Clostridiales bacterium]
MRKKDKGFTFIELILYMAILGIFMVAVMSLVTTTVASNKKQKSRQKLQTQATETYDYISNILMGAMDVAVAATDSKGDMVSYVVPDNMIAKDISAEATGRLITGGKTTSPVSMGIAADVADTPSTSLDCYDMASAAADMEAEYLWFSYSPALEKTTFCTVKYDKGTKVLSIVREGETSDDALTDSVLKLNKKYIDKGTAATGDILAKNVSSFKVTVDQDNNSVGLIIGFEDDKTGEKYEVSGVVGLRNSFVLKKHEWN